MKREKAATFTVATATQEKAVAKRYFLNNEGELERSTAAQLYSADLAQKQVASASDLAAVLQELEPGAVLIFGVPPQNASKMVTRAKFETDPDAILAAGAIPRATSHFKWPEGAGVMMLDYDPPERARALTRDELLESLKEAVPALEQSALVAWSSSSSHIYNGEEDLTGLRGQRVYLLVQSAADIPRAGRALVQRLWLKGHGYYRVAKNGAALERSLVDATVWQTNRIDFAGGAICEPPLEQRRGLPHVQDGEFLDTLAAIPELSTREARALRQVKATARASVEDEQRKQEALWLREYTKKHAAKLIAEGVERREAERRATRTAKAARMDTLTADFVLYVGSERKPVTVAEVLADPERYHGARCADPIDPDYDGGRLVGKIYTDGVPNVYSYARGGHSFKIRAAASLVILNKGATATATDDTVDILQDLPNVYDFGERLAAVYGGALKDLNEDSLAYLLGANALYVEQKEEDGRVTQRRIDPPKAMIKQVLSKGSSRGLKKLDALITAPAIALDGSTIDQPGYHRSARLHLHLEGDQRVQIPERVTPAEAERAARELLQVFDGFPCATALDRSALLVAILTAVQRPILPTAPAIGINAPTQGTGKTYLAETLSVLSTGSSAVSPMSGRTEEAEMKKSLFSTLLSGDRALIIDNVLGAFDSPSFATFITGPDLSDRVLGESSKVTIPNRVFTLVTGNNLNPAGDLPRRLLMVRLDAEMEHPAMRTFETDPKRIMQDNRALYAAKALTVIKGYLDTLDRVPEQKTGAFGDWLFFCARPVQWLAEVAPGLQLVDPLPALYRDAAEDPEQEALRLLLAALMARFRRSDDSNPFTGGSYETDTSPFTASAVRDAAYGMHFQGMNSLEPLERNLRDAISSALNRRIGETVSAGSIGKMLAARVGRRVAGLQLIRLKDTRGNAATYQVIEV